MHSETHTGAQRMGASLAGPDDPIVEAGANQSFLLDTGGIWIVEQGRVDVFCLKTDPGGAVAARTHLARVLPGQCVVGVNGEASDGTPARGAGVEAGSAAAGGTSSDAGVLQAVGSAGTTLRFVSPAAAAARFAEADLRAEGARLVDAWVDAVYDGLTVAPMPRDRVALQPGAPVRLEAARRAGPGASVSWVGHLEGESLLLGRSGMPLRAEVVPCSARAWIETTAPCVLTMTSTRAMLDRGDLWTGLAVFQRMAVRGALAVLDERAAGERRRQRRRDVVRQTLLRDAFTDLVTAHDAAAAASDRPGPVVPVGPADAPAAADVGMLAACRLVGEALGLTLTAPSTREAAALSDPVAAVAKASTVRVRQVRLEDRWWTSDSGPLLGRTDGDDARWVALLPTSSSGYAVCDPADGTRRPVTPAVAATLSRQAHTFYRAFPAARLSLSDVIRFGIRGCRRDLWLVVGLGLIGGALGLVTPVAIGTLFNSVIPGAERGQLLQITLILLACACATGMFELVRRFALTRVDGRMGAAVQAAIWDRLLSLPLGFFRPYSTGDLAVRAMGIDAMRKTLSGATVTAALGGLFSLSNFGLLFHYGGALAWWATLLLAVSGGVTLLAGYGQLRLQRQIVPLRTKTSGLVLQLLTGIAKLRVAAAEPHAFAQWARLFSRQRRLQFRSRTVSNWLRVFNAVFPTLALLVTMAAATGGGNVMPEIRTGDFLAFSSAFGACQAAMVSISTAVMEALGIVPVYENARPILDAAPEVNSAKGDPGALAGRIEAHHLTFHYQPDMPPALQDVSFSVAPGEFAAFVGPSGSGKSTLLRVLLGFEAPDAGSVYFDGQDFGGLDVQAVRSQIGVVLQSGRIMAGDFFTNIVGSAAHTIEDAWEAARMAGLADDIKAMPMGMHTVVSEGAGTLSGGQRQRLLIARAIVNKPRIIFFDEATSALDNRTQAIVSESLERLNATRLVIAHRLSTIVHADRIYVMQRGRIVQAGRHAELLAQEGPFAELARRQTS